MPTIGDHNVQAGKQPVTPCVLGEQERPPDTPGILDVNRLSGTSGMQFSVEVTFDDDSPLTVGGLPEDQDLIEVSVVVLEAFNGVNPTLKVGTTSDDDVILEAVDTELGVANIKFAKGVNLAGPEDFIVTLTLSGATAGKVLVILEAALREGP